MLILAQDKRTIANLENITQIYCIEYDKSNVDIACCFNRGGEILGRYSSIERCKEIMQDILTAYQRSEENKALIIGAMLHSFGSREDKYKFTYTMPEE